MATAHTPAVDAWETHWASAVDSLVSSTIRELLKVIEQPGVISFAGGLPAPDAFPAEEITAAAERVLAQQPARVLQYGPTEGFPPLREFLSALMHERGVPVGPEGILISSGSQQALDIIGKLMIDQGDTVLVEDPTYMGALQAWRPYQPRFATVPTDNDGLLVDELEARLIDLERAGRQAKFLYVVSAFQNPTGVTLSSERRTDLIELAARYNLPIVEDDPYGELRYSGTPQRSLASIDIEMHGAPRQVAYFSTFSKLLAPSLRVGWITGPEALLRRVVQVKQGIDLHTGTLAQAIAYEACKDGLLKRHVPVIRSIYHERRDAMLRALEQHMPAGVEWTKPDGGMFLWVTLPEGVDTAPLLGQALEQKVAFVPGGAFFANGGGANTMRLNFSHSHAKQIEEGIARLAEVIRAALPE